MIDIYMTSFFRKHFTERAVREIHERTAPGTFALHIFDNGSDLATVNFLIKLYEEKKITSLHLDTRNTGCFYNKGVFHMMTDAQQPYYCVTDNDIFPPKLTPDWLSQMIAIMDAHPDIAFLAPQLPPQFLQMPDMSMVYDDVVYCKAVGNTFKIVRRSAFPLDKYVPTIGAYGDDGIVSRYAMENGHKIAFCRKIFCFHAGQCKNWGYKDEEINLDPRKKGYGGFFKYPLLSEDTYEPAPVELKI